MRTGSSFPWQSLALELIPNGSRPNNYLIATAKSYKEYGKREYERFFFQILEMKQDFNFEIQFCLQ